MEEVTLSFSYPRLILPQPPFIAHDYHFPNLQHRKTLLQIMILIPNILLFILLLE